MASSIMMYISSNDRTLIESTNVDFTVSLDEAIILPSLDYTIALEDFI